MSMMASTRYNRSRQDRINNARRRRDAIRSEIKKRNKKRAYSDKERMKRQAVDSQNKQYPIGVWLDITPMLSTQSQSYLSESQKRGVGQVIKHTPDFVSVLAGATNLPEKPFFRHSGLSLSRRLRFSFKDLVSKGVQIVEVDA